MDCKIPFGTKLIPDRRWKKNGNADHDQVACINDLFKKNMNIYIYMK